MANNTKKKKNCELEENISVIQLVKEIRQIALTSSNDSYRLKAYDMLMKHTGGYFNEFSIIQKLGESDLEALADKLIDRLTGANVKQVENEEEPDL